MGGITWYNIYNLYLYPSHLIRKLQLFFVMIYVCSIWTYIAYKKGFRKVESEFMMNGENVIEKKNIINTFFVLGYDVLFEIGIAYLTFYNWFIFQ